MNRPNDYSYNLKVFTGILKENAYLIRNICNLCEFFCKWFLLIFFTWVDWKRDGSTFWTPILVFIKIKKLEVHNQEENSLVECYKENQDPQPAVEPIMMMMKKIFRKKNFVMSFRFYLKELYCSLLANYNKILIVVFSVHIYTLCAFFKCYKCMKKGVSFI